MFIQRCTFLLIVLMFGLNATAAQSGPWRWANPTPQGNDLYGIAYSGTTYVAVGINAVLSSPDSRNWVSVSNSNFSSVAYGNGRFVAAGGNVATSVDGTNWISQPSACCGYIASVLWTGDKFVAVGNIQIRISSDGLTWQNKAPPTVAGYNFGLSAQATDGAGTVVVVGEADASVGAGYAGLIVTSTDGGNTWSLESYNVFNPLVSVVYVGTQFVALSNQGDILVSTDGKGWNKAIRSLDSTISWQTLAWNGTQVVAVGNGGHLAVASAGVSSWTAQPYPGLNPTSLLWDGHQFVSVGKSGEIWTGGLGSWTAGSQDVTQGNSLLGIAWNGTYFLGVGRNETLVTSPDGINWRHGYKGTPNLNAVTAVNDTFIMVGDNGTILTSSNPRSGFEQQSSGTTSALLGVVYGVNRAIAVGHKGTGFTDPGIVLISTDADFSSWTEVNPHTQFGLDTIGFSKNASNLFVAGSGDGLWLSNNGGINWTHVDHSSSIASVDSNGSRFVAVGFGGIYTSTDGSTWTKATSPSTSPLNAVHWDGSHFIAGGWGSEILISSDGVNWNSESSPYGKFVNAIASNGVTPVVVGNSGLIGYYVDAIFANGFE